MLKIEKGIPIPKGNTGNNAIYPWKDMKVGDSFFVAGKTATQFGGHITTARYSTGFKFTSRTVDGGVRVWRVE